MDNPEQCPPDYVETTEGALRDTAALIEYVYAVAGRQKGGAATSSVLPLVQPVITPRFLPSCTDELLSGLGALAAKYQCRVQSHCSESKWVVQYGDKRFGSTDAEVYDRFGLLGWVRCRRRHALPPVRVADRCC